MSDILVVDVSSANAMGAAPGRASLQDDLDWAWLVAQGVRGAIVESYVGNDGPNLDMQDQLRDAQAAGLVTGVYQFLFPLPVVDGHINRRADLQAELHYANAPRVAGSHLPTFADGEWPNPSKWAQWGCSASQVADWLALYLETYDRLSGETTGVYSYPSWWAEVGFDAGERPHWMAGSDATAGAVLWQRTGEELLVPTRSGRPTVKTDCSLFAGDDAAWASFCGQ